MTRPLGIGLYGCNGHQIFRQAVSDARARLLGFAGFRRAQLPDFLQDRPSLREYSSLEAMLEDPEIILVSLCSPRRDQQAWDAIRCLEAGKHVYAEKPCALSENDLDAILESAARRGLRFHEMAGTAFEQPYREMGRLVRLGTLGTLVQVFVQKSYPWFDHRPADEGVDGGLLRQAGIHAVRFIEHLTGLRSIEVVAMETRTGLEAVPGACRRAGQMMVRLSNGALACAIVNYLHPHRPFGSWGNEHVRIFGTAGFVESVDAGRRTRLVLQERDAGPLEPSEPALDWFRCYLDELTGEGGFPISLEEELHPTRIVIRAKNACR